LLTVCSASIYCTCVCVAQHKIIYWRRMCTLSRSKYSNRAVSYLETTFLGNLFIKSGYAHGTKSTAVTWWPIKISSHYGTNYCFLTLAEENCYSPMKRLKFCSTQFCRIINITKLIECWGLYWFSGIQCVPNHKLSL